MGRFLVGRGLRWGLVLGVWGLVGAGAILAWVWSTLPDIDALASSERQPSVTLKAADGSLIATYGDLYGERLRLGEMPSALPAALIATEDRRFYQHWGIDPWGILRAAWTDLRAGRWVQGGSTVTQQLAKNLFLSPDRTLKRKLQELVLAIRLEHRLTKDQILEVYLNRVYFGAGAYGVDAAARRYFGKSARRLGPYESALLIGLLKAPSRFSPAVNRDRAAARTRQVLLNMVDAGLIGAAEADRVSRQATLLAGVPVTKPGLRYFADWVEDQIAAAGYAGDLVVTTTLDPHAQAAAEAAVEAGLSREGSRVGAGEAALIALDPDGAVRAMVGGRDYQASQFNRTTQAARQPGSSFKPFVYLAALEQGVRPDEMVEDQPIRIGGWQPHNFGNEYRGAITVAEAFAQSSNVVAAQLAERAGIARVIAVAHRLGITASLPGDASLALGSGEVSLIDLVTAYCAFASGGEGAIAHAITEIRAADGTILMHRTGGGPGRVIRPDLDETMIHLMVGVIDHGTGRAAHLNRPAAGKTGTSSDFRDALFVGFTADLVAGVWVGNDDNSPMKGVTGGQLPARIWRDFMTTASAGHPARPLWAPPVDQPGDGAGTAAPTSPAPGGLPTTADAIEALIRSTEAPDPGSVQKDGGGR